MAEIKKKQTAVIGFPLSHSLSLLLHNSIYAAEKISAQMRAVANQDVAALVKQIRETPFELIAVTIPHKQTIMSFLDEIDATVKAIGAVNTVINKKGKLFGYNTDVVGITKALESIAIQGKDILVIGAGGAALAAGYYIQQKRGNLFCLNRSLKHASAFIQKFGGHIATPLMLREKHFDLIINATPIGMAPNSSESPLPNYTFNSNQIIFDLIYNPFETRFLKEAKITGAKIISGLTMLIAQGLEQERLWYGKKLNHEKYERIVRNTLTRTI